MYRAGLCLSDMMPLRRCFYRSHVDGLLLLSCFFLTCANGGKFKKYVWRQCYLDAARESWLWWFYTIHYLLGFYVLVLFRRIWMAGNLKISMATIPCSRRVLILVLVILCSTVHWGIAVIDNYFVVFEWREIWKYLWEQFNVTVAF